MEVEAKIVDANDMLNRIDTELAQEADLKSGSITDPQKRTDNASAVRFIDHNGRHFRHVYTWEKWLAWDGRRWSLKSGKNRVYQQARKYADSLWSEARDACQQRSQDVQEIVKFVEGSNKKDKIKSIIDLATCDPRVAIDHDVLDADPYLFNCQNGTLDLKSMAFRDHQQEDLLTQVANVHYDMNAECPLWLETLNYVFAGNAGLISYFQQALGYSLAGITDEHVLIICYGEGNNGKSTIWNAVHEIVGDYAWHAKQELLLPVKERNHPTEMAALCARRFVTISEPEQGRKLAEAKVKELTGDRVVTARRMHEDFWQFTPTHTLWMATNHRPRVAGNDTGIWRRIKLIPFTIDLSDVVKVDKTFPNKLKAEHSGILNWMLEGWKSYSANGLVEPDIIKQATAEYRSSEDEIGLFVSETYVVNPNFIVAASDAFEAYQQWGGKLTKTAFGTEISKRFNKTKHAAGQYRNKWVYEGIGVLE